MNPLCPFWPLLISAKTFQQSTECVCISKARLGWEGVDTGEQSRCPKMGGSQKTESKKTPGGTEVSHVCHSENHARSMYNIHGGSVHGTKH